MKIIRKFSIIYLVTVCALSVAVTAYTQTEEYKEYTVKKGDTLWNISSKEVSDPFLWPKIWKENPDIKNPDLIYPGQTVKIPLRLTSKGVAQPEEAKPPQIKEIGKTEVITPTPVPERKMQPRPKEVRTETAIRPVEIKYLIDKDALISSGYISDTVDGRGEIIGSPSEQSLLGTGDYAYIRTLMPVSAGQKFYIIRSMGKVKHPETGAMMGYLIDVLGIAEVVGIESGEVKTRIITSYDGILVGDLVADFYDVEQPFVIGEPRSPEIEGFIVATRKIRILNGMLNVVYIDKGAKDGLEVGDAMGIVSRSQYSIPNGSIQIISLKDKTATAIVIASQKEVTTGDLIVHAQKGSAPKLAAREPQQDESLEDAVNLFISQYVQVYESGDIDKFMSFYSSSAIENNRLHYDDIRRAYEKGFRGGRYTYNLSNIRMNKDNGHIILAGTYTIRKSSGGQTRGNITWTLARENGVLKIIRVDYDRG